MKPTSLSGMPRMALGAAALDGHLEPPLPLRRALLALLTCSWHTVMLLRRRLIRQPSAQVGRRIDFADGTSAEVYRETALDRSAADPVVLVVSFRLRWVHRRSAHALFRLESELNTVLFGGFPGLVSKLWLRHDQQDRYRGFYQWDGAERAVAYVRALWWVLALVSERDSIEYAVLPGLRRDDVLADPDLVNLVVAAPAGWWRPVHRPATDP
jgi:hypothetical protein